MSEEQNMSAWIRLMLQEIDQKQAEAAESEEEAKRRAAAPVETVSVETVSVGAASAANPDSPRSASGKR